MEEIKKESLFFFPSEPSTGYQNPYCNHYKESLYKHFNVLDKEKDSVFKRIFTLIVNSCKADVFVFNWIESIIFWRYGFLQFLLAIVALFIIKCRRKKVIWMFHNIHPHNGKNVFTDYIQNWMYKHASFVISHSKEAADYVQKLAKGKVIFLCHPIEAKEVEKSVIEHTFYDVFIWGAIEPYKGVTEFLSSGISQKMGLSVKVLGKCQNQELEKTIKKYCTDTITYENRHADFAEIAQYCKIAKYVLFPYVGDCVSSSGALIDTIVLGGTPVGPNIGAFKDLSEESVCLTYNNYEDLGKLLGETINIDEESRNRFIKHNSWENFSNIIIKLLK